MKEGEPGVRLLSNSHAWIGGSLSRSARALLLAAVVLAGATAHGVSVAAPPAPPSPDNPANPYADDKVVPREMMRQFREREARDDKRKSDEAKAQRKASRRAYKDKSKHEALAIAREKFADFLSAPTWSGLDLPPGQRVKQYVDDFQALVQVGDDRDEVALVESDLPLRDPDGDPTDLSLEPAGDGFAPRAAGVELELPGDLGEGISVDDGRVRVTPATDSTTVPIETDDKVFYANAQTDTDVTVAPTAKGFETFTQLRSADSPEQLSFDVAVPGGATLRAAGGRAAADEQPPIEVISPGGERLATISPPRAVAADQEPVDAAYSINGDRVTMHVAHRYRDVAYPIMVDPDYIFEDWRHWATGNRDTYGWQSGSWGHPWCGWGAYFGQGTWTYGRVVYHPDNYYCEVDNWAEWKFQAPRMSYIYRAEYHYMNHQNRFTCMVAAIWGPWSGNWDGSPWVLCDNRYNDSHGHCPAANCDWNAGQPSNVAVFKVQICCGNGNRNPGARAELGGSLIYLRDRDNPVIDTTGHNTDGRWYRSGTMTVAPRAHDDGLGMNKFQLTIPGFVDDYRRHPCIRSRCPGSWSLPNDGQAIFSYNLPDLPNGINTVTLNARDALDKITPASWSVNVDDELPDLQVDGPLWDAETGGSWTGTKTLNIRSSDGVYPYSGNPTSARAGVTSVEILVDGVRKEYRTQNCFANCRLDFSWSLNADLYVSGTHSIQVIARDGAGNQRSSTWTVSTLPRDPGTGDRGDEVPDGAEGPLTPTEGQADTCEQASNQTTTPDCAPLPGEQAALAEPALAPTNALGAATINRGSEFWGFAEQQRDVFALAENDDTKFKEPRFARLGINQLRIYVPWDVIQRVNGDGSFPGTAKSKYCWWREDGQQACTDEGWGPEPYEQSQLRGFDASFAEIKRLMDLENTDPNHPNRLKGLVVAIYSTEATTPYGGDPQFKLGPRVLPSPATYIENVKAIIARIRSIIAPPGDAGSQDNLAKFKYIEAFNEPNHRSYAPSGIYSYPQYKNYADKIQRGAKLAAYYYNELRRHCKTDTACAPVAGSFVDLKELTDIGRPNEERYFYWYKHYLEKKNPPVWAYHPYNAATEVVPTDGKTVKRMTRRRVQEFLEATKPKPGSSPSSIWFTEAGPLYRGSNGNQRSEECLGKTDDDLRVCQWNLGKKMTDFLISLPEMSSRIKRFYYYSWRGDANLHDSGMVDRSRETPGYSRARQLRPAYCAYGAITAPPFSFPADGDEIRACPYEAVKGD